MKKKPLNIVLIIVLLFIWGSIIKKYFGNGTSVDNQTVMNMPMANYNYDDAVAKDSFQLKLTNTNPFKTIAKKRSNQKAVVTHSKPNRVAPKTQLKTKKPWPKMSYHGFVKSKDKATKLVLLKVAGKLYRKREAEKINELTVVKAYKDSLILSLNNEQKSIIKINETQ